MPKKRKRKKTKSKYQKPVQRKASDFSNRYLVLERPIAFKTINRHKKSEIKHKKIIITDDRRFYLPLVADRALLTDGRPSKIIVKPTGGHLQTKEPLRFEDPRRTIVCIRRKQRRKSLFALSKVGKGKGGPKHRKLTRDSKVRC